MISPGMWIDSHAHLSDIPDDELRALLEDACINGVGRILDTATNISTAHAVLAQCTSYPEILRAAVGISPFDTVDAPADWFVQLRNLFSNPLVVAIGEIGLDNSNPRYPPAECQRPFLEAQLRLARDLNLPAIVHSRGSETETIRLCKEIGLQKVLFHCFTGSEKELRALLDEGFYVSIAGIITFKNATALRSLLNFIPLDRLLIETDTPYLAPEPFRGHPNTPSLLHCTGEEVSRLVGKDVASLQEILRDNFIRLFTVSNLDNP